MSAARTFVMLGFVTPTTRAYGNMQSAMASPSFPRIRIFRRSAYCMAAHPNTYGCGSETVLFGPSRNCSGSILLRFIHSEWILKNRTWCSHESALVSLVHRSALGKAPYYLTTEVPPGRSCGSERTVLRKPLRRRILPLRRPYKDGQTALFIRQDPWRGEAPHNARGIRVHR